MVDAGLILLYHRVAELASDPQLLAVTPAHFDEHLEVLRDHGVPMSLTEMIPLSRDRRLPHPAIAVTFDDGYEDTFEYGEPLLARHDVPATMFVTTSYMGATREFWWDDLERLLLLPGRLPEVLRLRVGHRAYEWRLDDDAVYGDVPRVEHRGWNIECPANPSSRHRVYRDLCGLLRAVPADARRAAIDELAQIAGAPSAGRSSHQPLSPERLARAGESRVDIGAHSMTHSVLAALSEAEQRCEIVGSRTRVREITGREPAAFSYPFGGRADYTRKTVALVREAGFALACANIGGLVRSTSDPLQLPRLLVRDCDGDMFAARVREWCGD